MLEFILADLLAVLPPSTDHLVVKMSSNLEDLHLDQPADQPPNNKQQQMQCIMGYIYYGMYLVAILDSSRKARISFYF